ncbi:MAG: DUF3106 domain-containing protein [Alistipes senegalensis]|nr:DUF3106 domain-containing protein [Oxalobacter formigenes]MCM1281892.1 DUF3106 domain-containing protein [Alistipes senegalensis]
MRWFDHRFRIFLFAVILFLLLTVAVIGIARIVNPELNLMEMAGLCGGETAASPSRPYWTELTDTQRDLLSPLETVWDNIAPVRKEKWIQVAQRIERMPPDEQLRFRERIRIWASLTPQERQEARQNYLNAKKLGLKDKSLQWLEYQNLPEEEKRKLAATARKKRRLPPAPPRETKPVELPAQPVEATQPAREEPDYWR